jgi:DNA-binding PucR family transcriptional regulator
MAWESQVDPYSPIPAGESDGAPRRVDDHLGLIALRDPDGVLSALHRDRLGPLLARSAGVRARLELTLLTWLERQGNRAATTRALEVHEQTVRYHMNQLRELLGDALDNPNARLRCSFHFALRVRRML